MGWPILVGVMALIHGALFWTDFHGYARVLTRSMGAAERGRYRRYSLGEGRYRRMTGPRWELEATPMVRRLFGGWAFLVGTIAIVLGLSHH